MGQLRELLELIMEHMHLALTPDRVTGKQIEAARVALTRHMKRQGRVWTRIFPNIPVSKNLLKYVWEKVKDLLNITHVE